jgi:HK97 family phage portal protein
MGLFSKKRKAEPQNMAGASLSNEDAILDLLFGRLSTASGADVTPLTAMGVSTVYACVNRISKTVASLPLKLYRRTDGGKEPASDHPLYTLLHDAPNPDMTSFDFRSAMQGNLTLRQNAVALIVRNGLGRVAELIPVDPTDLSFESGTAGRVGYKIKGEQVDASRILHLRGFSTNGLVGIDLLYSVREIIGLAIALQDNAARFFGNGSRPGAILEHPKVLSDEAAKRLRESFERLYKGNENAGRVAVLEEGLKYVAQRHNNNDSQFVESRKVQDNAIAQVFGIPPHKVGLLDRATFSNIEQQNIEYVQDTVLPFLRTWEQTLNAKLLTPAERTEYFFEYNADGLLRGDFKSRMEGYAIGRQWGWLNVDEIRALENLNKLPDGKGETYLEPLNMTPAGEGRNDDE